ncbi:ABC transporter B family member 26 chloroplastic [Bienertia sinuspersici]
MVFRRNVALLTGVGLNELARASKAMAFLGAACLCYTVKRMRETLYSSLMLQDISFFDASTVGDLTSRLGADCQQVSRVIGNDLNMISRNILQTRKREQIAGMHLAASDRFMLIFLYQKKAAKLTQDFTASANDVAQETLSLMRTVRVYGTEEQELGRYEVWLQRLAGISLRQSAAYGLWNVSFNTLYHSTQVIAVLVGGMSILSGRLSAEQLTKFLLYSEWLIYSTWWIGDNVSNLMQSVGASEKVFQMMDLLPSEQFISEAIAGIFEEEKRRWREVSRMRTEREREGKRESRDGEKVKVIVDGTVACDGGDNGAGIGVGLSGSGKSTVVNLLLRLYEPTGGKILIDDLPLNNIDARWLRESIGYVGQEPRLFRADISSNIKYGCPKEVTQEDVEWAAKQASVHDFISSLPNGYDTIVDHDLLSGGQKQRIAIARAVLRDPSILILDEATSALDAESEHNIKVGGHKELLLKDGLYARLTRRQADAVA